MSIARANSRGLVACLVMAIAVVSPFGAAFAQDGDADARDYLIWQAAFGAGSSQSTEIILDNTRCEAYASGDVYINEDQQLGQRIPVQLAPGASLVVPVPGPPSPGVESRRLLAVRVRLDRGPCAAPGRFQASGVVVNPDGTTDGVWLMLSPLPKGEHIIIHETPATRLGPDQVLEYAVWNGCPVHIVAEFETTNLLTGETKPSTLEVGPFQIIAVLPEIGDVSQVRLVGFGTLSVRTTDRSQADPCPPGQGFVTIFTSLVNTNDGTTQASGLPTGKRQHYPLTR